MRVLTRRAELADLCNDEGIVSAVEVGTHRAGFAAAFLERFRGTLRCVDPYLPYPGDALLWPASREPDGTRRREDDLDAARKALRRFGARAEIRTLTSAVGAANCEAEGWFPGFVYLDGDHREEAVLRDIDLWWPLVAPGGIMAGHDWEDCPEWQAGIRRAVRARLGEPELIPETGQPWSWWVRKPGVPA
ncbi:MAG TPA: class I SAM-dependent methyltransferase [Planctomycetota bacterium]|nr:class I SAM-dependent methyltransferase [Planctomycetota bacterium]